MTDAQKQADLDRLRAERPDLILHYGAAPAGQWPTDLALASQFDVLDFHLPVGMAMSKPPIDKPVAVTEYELTPTAPEWDTVVPVAKDAAAIGLNLFVWGADQQTADINLHPDLTVQLNALNQSTGEPPVAVDPIQAQIDDLKKQVADFTELGRRVTEGHYNGAGGSAAIVLALEDNNPPKPIAPQPDFK